VVEVHFVFGSFLLFRPHNFANQRSMHPGRLVPRRRVDSYTSTKTSSPPTPPTQNVLTVFSFSRSIFSLSLAISNRSHFPAYLSDVSSSMMPQPPPLCLSATVRKSHRSVEHTTMDFVCSFPIFSFPISLYQSNGLTAIFCRPDPPPKSSTFPPFKSSSSEYMGKKVAIIVERFSIVPNN